MLYFCKMESYKRSDFDNSSICGTILHDSHCATMGMDGSNTMTMRKELFENFILI